MTLFLRHSFFVLVCFLCLHTISHAQTPKRISVALQTESISPPIIRTFPLHLGGEVGLLLKQTEKTKSFREWNAFLGFYHHKRVQNAFYVRGDYTHRLKIKSSFTFDMIGGLGYMHTFYPSEVYELNSSTGEFEEITQTGKARAIAQVGVGFSYIKNPKFQPFFRVESGIETPFANGIPFILHSFIKIGTHIKL